MSDATNPATIEAWTDPKTGLEWELNPPRERMAWQEAMDRCAALGDGWRLPTIEELRTIVDRSVSNPAVVAPLREHDASAYYWSASAIANIPSNAWFVYTDYGDEITTNKTYSYFVRAVRSGSSAIRPLDDNVTQARKLIAEALRLLGGNSNE